MFRRRGVRHQEGRAAEAENRTSRRSAAARGAESRGRLRRPGCDADPGRAGRRHAEGGHAQGLRRWALCREDHRRRQRHALQGDLLDRRVVGLRAEQDPLDGPGRMALRPGRHRPAERRRPVLESGRRGERDLFVGRQEHRQAHLQIQGQSQEASARPCASAAANAAAPSVSRAPFTHGARNVSSAGSRCRPVCADCASAAP